MCLTSSTARSSTSRWERWSRCRAPCSTRRTTRYQTIAVAGHRQPVITAPEPIFARRGPTEPSDRDRPRVSQRTPSTRSRTDASSASTDSANGFRRRDDDERRGRDGRPAKSREDLQLTETCGSTARGARRLLVGIKKPIVFQHAVYAQLDKSRLLKGTAGVHTRRAHRPDQLSNVDGGLGASTTAGPTLPERLRGALAQPLRLQCFRPSARNADQRW